MYLVRTIQKNEDPSWVDKLGVELDQCIPLPFIPQKQFDRVIIIHNDRAIELAVDCIEKTNQPVIVGSASSIKINSCVNIFFKEGVLRTGKSKIKGFTGIRYKNKWEEVAY